MTDGPWLACSSPFGSTYGLGRRPEVRQGGQGCPRTKPCSFQSPSGVLGVCRGEWPAELPILPVMEFQSPSGVLGVCGAPGVFECLAKAFEVSVPFRGFRGLRVPPDTIITDLSGVKFQSPSGVLGVCGPYVGTVAWDEALVSVPFRGFRGLRVSTTRTPRASSPRFSPLPGF